MKRAIRLTESDLRNIVRMSVNKVLREGIRDFDDIDVDGLYNSLKTYNENPVDVERDIDYEPSDEELKALEDFDLDTDFSDLMSGQYTESKKRMGRIIRESIRKVLKEGAKGVDPDNAVPEDLARQYGFESEYADSANGLELWGKHIPNGNPNKLLFKLGIRNFTSISNTATGMHVRITVKPNQRINDRMRTPRKIGDYINSNYGDDKGIIFNNPKNGHTRRLDKFGKFN